MSVNVEQRSSKTNNYIRGQNYFSITVNYAHFCFIILVNTTCTGF